MGKNKAQGRDIGKAKTQALHSLYNRGQGMREG